FSSRRRHTRWPRDWSSDVCSSDLPNGRVLSVASWAVRIFEAATICIALVICAVLLTDLIRRRRSRWLGITHRAGVHVHVCVNASATVVSSALNAPLSAVSLLILVS